AVARTSPRPRRDGAHGPDRRRPSGKSARAAMWLDLQAAREHVEVGAGELRIISAIEAAVVNEVGVRKRKGRGDMFSVERLQLDVSGDHRTNLDSGGGKDRGVVLEELAAPA